METKQVLVICKGTTPKMRRGKEIAQGAHAAMAWLTLRLVHTGDWREGQAANRYAVRLSDAERAWLESSFRKVTCYVDSAVELVRVHDEAVAAGLEAHLITDSGHTEFGGEPTLTALAVGPDWDEKIDPVTGHLPLY